MSAEDDEPSDLTSMVRNKRRSNKKDAGSLKDRLQARRDRARDKASSSKNQENSSHIIDDARRTVRTDDTKLHEVTGQSHAASETTSVSRHAFNDFFTTNQPHTPENKARDQTSPSQTALQEDFEDIDLEDKDPRSPSDDPDYDIIDVSEATHSARNAQSDRADKYPEHDAQPMPAIGHAGEGDAPGGQGKPNSSVARNWRRGWFF